METFPTEVTAFGHALATESGRAQAMEIAQPLAMVVGRLLVTAGRCWPMTKSYNVRDGGDQGAHRRTTELCACRKPVLGQFMLFRECEYDAG